MLEGETAFNKKYNSINGLGRLSNNTSSSLGIKFESNFVACILLIFSISATCNPPAAEKSIRAENSTFPNASILRFETLLITLLKHR